MSDTVRDYQNSTSPDTNGLDDLFCAAPVPTSADLCLAPVPTNANECPAPVPVEIAAQSLGLSLNALKKQLRKGSIAGFKQETKHGSKWFVEASAVPRIGLENQIEPGSLPQLNTSFYPEPVPISTRVPLAPVPTDASQLSAPVPTGAEKVPVEIPQTRLVEILEQQTKELQGAYWRNGRLESHVTWRIIWQSLANYLAIFKGCQASRFRPFSVTWAFINSGFT
jgi:hypothetical protein